MIEHFTPLLKLEVEILYTNYKGSAGWRRIIPRRLFFGTSPFHPDEQWLLEAYDVNKKEERTFAMNQIHMWRVP